MLRPHAIDGDFIVNDSSIRIAGKRSLSKLAIMTTATCLIKQTKLNESDIIAFEIAYFLWYSGKMKKFSSSLFLMVMLPLILTRRR